MVAVVVAVVVAAVTWFVGEGVALPTGPDSENQPTPNSVTAAVAAVAVTFEARYIVLMR